MFSEYLKNEQVLYLNDRHEEKGVEHEARYKLYDDRIAASLGSKDLAIFAKKIDSNLFSYYRSLGLANFRKENIFTIKNYLKYQSLTKAALNNDYILRPGLKKQIIFKVRIE